MAGISGLRRDDFPVAVSATGPIDRPSTGFCPVMTLITEAGHARMSPLGLALLAVASVGWGLNFPIMKNLLSEWPPLSSRGLCGIFGAAALALIALARRQSLAVSRPMWSRLVLVSLLTIGGCCG